MGETIIASVITGVLALIGVIVTAIVNNNKIQATLEKSQAITDIKIENLTNELKEQNNFVKNIPVIEEQIKVINHRLEDLERKESQ